MQKSNSLKKSSVDANGSSPSSKQKTTMSVAAMAHLLGIHKTESYWLLHKNYFDTVIVNGHTRILLDSFEQWYANQFHYQKTNGTPAGSELMQLTYSVSELAKMLAVTESTIYVLISRGLFETLPNEHSCEQARVLKDSFDLWYESQTHYRNAEDRESDAAALKASISMPEMRHLLGLKHRNNLYHILNSPKYKDMFEFVMVGDQKRITKESFLLWYASQDHYSLQFASIESAQKDLKAIILKNLQRKPKNTKSQRLVKASEHSANPDYYSVDDVAELLNMRHESVIRKLRKGEIPGKKVARSYRIPRDDFNEWFLYHADRKRRI